MFCLHFWCKTFHNQFLVYSYFNNVALVSITFDQTFAKVASLKALPGLIIISSRGYIEFQAVPEHRYSKIPCSKADGGLSLIVKVA